MRRLSVILLGAFLFANLTAGTQESIDPSLGFTLKNKHVSYVFEAGGMGLSGMIDLETGHNHIDPVDGKRLLWKIAFGKGMQHPAIDNNYKACSFGSLSEKRNGDQVLTLEWNDLRFWNEDSICSVKVTIELPAKEGIARWGISVSNRSDYWGLWEVACPAVNGFPAKGKYDIAIPVTGTGGHLLKNWEGSLNQRSPSGFFPMQFMSFSSGTNAVFFSSMDGESRAKDFAVDSKKQELSLVRYPENMGVEGSDLPGYYKVSFGPYQGGWLEAAHRYRDWAMKQVWTAKGPISQRPEFPEMATNIGFWVRDTWIWDISGVEKDTGHPATWRRDEGDPHEMNRAFLNAMETMGVPIAFQWYGWHTPVFDNDYPHFLPPLKGFTERVAELVDAGALIVPYINGLSADSKTWDWNENFDAHAIKDQGGGLHQHFYRDGAGRLTPMCPHQNYWHFAINNVVDSIINVYGTNGIYMDEISCNSHELCFNPDHRHPLGGGRYWADGYRKLYRKTINIAQQNGKDAVITSESANEIFFDQVSGNLFTGRPTDYEIPMLQVVYSGYTLFYASRCNFGKSDRFFNFCVGQGFIDGKQIGWMDFDLFRPKYRSKVEYMKNCARYRMVTKKYLTFGRLWEPVHPVKPVPVFEEEFIGGGAHTAKVPSAEARLWQAEDGNIALFIANYVDEEVEFSYTLDPVRYGLDALNYQVREITPEGSNSIGESGKSISRTEKLGPKEVKVLEFIPLSKTALLSNK